jgi:arylsulfatase A-like enzyme
VLALGDLVLGIPGALAVGAGPAALLGALAVLFLDVVAGVAFGLLATPFLLAWSDREGLERAAASLRTFGRALVRPGARADEARRVAWLVTVGILGLAALALLVVHGASALPRVRRDPVLGIAYGAQALLVLLAAAAFAPALARAFTRLFAPIAGSIVSLRSGALAVAAAAAAAALAFRAPLTAFTRAVDLRPALLALLFLVAFFTALALILAAPRRALAATAPRALAIALAATTLLAAIVLGPASHSSRAARLYRGRAPVTSYLAALGARALDFDGDGYSAFLGDGDCAPSDPRRNPGAREVADNGLDDDCFDGDLGRQNAPFPPPPPAARPPQVPEDLSFVIILVDALRRDHVGLYGYPRATTPRVDAWSARAVVFDRAYSPGAFTNASVPAILTGKFPSMLPRRVMRKTGKVSAQDRTITEIFAAAGFQTGMISDNGGTLAETGVDKGFQRKLVIKDDSHKITDTALAYLEGFGPRKFFLWVDYFAPHGAYLEHDGVPLFGDGFVDMYDHEIRYADDAIGRLLDRLSQPDLAGRVVVAFVADHGEAFGEHGTYYHGHNLNEENVRVPFLLYVPGIEPRRLDAEPVSLLDLFPTFLNLARLPIPDVARGHDLTGVIATGVQPPGRRVFLENHFIGYGANTAYQAAVATRRHKLIEDTGTRQLMLFDLDRDPREQRDLSDDQPDLVLELRRASKYFQSFGRDD